MEELIVVFAISICLLFVTILIQYVRHDILYKSYKELYKNYIDLSKKYENLLDEELAYVTHISNALKKGESNERTIEQSNKWTGD